MLRNARGNGRIRQLQQEGRGGAGEDHHLAIDAPAQRTGPEKPGITRTGGARCARQIPQPDARLCRALRRQSSSSSI